MSVRMEPPKMKDRPQLFVSNIRWILDLTTGEWIPLGCGIVGMSVASTMNLIFPRVMGKAIDIACGKPAPRGLNNREFFVLAASTFVTGAVASFVRVYSLGMVAESIAARLRRRLYQSLLHQEYRFFHERKVGELLTRLSDDCQVTANAVVDVMASGFRSFNSALGGSCMLLAISPKLTLVALSILPLVGSVAMMFSKFSLGLAKRHQDELAQMNGIVEERLNHILTVKLYTAEKKELLVFDRKNHSVFQSALRAKAAKGLFMAGLSLSGNVSLLSVLYFGGCLVANGELTVGSLTSFALYSGFMGLGFSKLASCASDLKRARLSSKVLFDLLAMLPSTEEIQGTETLPDVKGDIEFVDVSFSYSSRSEALVLDQIRFQIQPGEIVAIVGKSGSGKSTIVSLMTKIIFPDSGSILLDGVNIASLNTNWLRRQIAVVLQDPSLLASPIFDNIAYGINHRDLKLVIEAAKEAHVHEFVAELPEKYDTFVGEKGSRFSGGQKQRIAIARALYKQAKILIFDEATSFLDNQSENVIRSTLERAARKQTVFVIAHRMNTIKHANRILVLQNGKITETGTYDQLNVEGTYFFSLTANHGQI